MAPDCKCSGRLAGPLPVLGPMQESAPAQPSFYRRKLPSPPAIDFASEEGKAIFTEALASGGLSGFFPLIAQFQTQAEPAYCGLASLAVTLNALSIDPGRLWRGPWRWFDEALLDCCEPLEKVKKEGIVFSTLVCLARCAGAGVKSVLASVGSERGFREDVRKAAGGGGGHVIAGYSRKEFLQTGDGHFSPIGGYHAARDLVLILDVARFKYPPHWVPLPLLWQSMQQTDKVTGESRGYVVLTPKAQPAAALFTLARPDSEWWAVAEYASAGISEVLRQADVSTAEEAIGAVLDRLPDDVTHLLTWIRAVAPAGEDAPLSREGQIVEAVKDKVLEQLRSLRIFGVVSSWVAAQTEQSVDTKLEHSEPAAYLNGDNQKAVARQTREELAADNDGETWPRGSLPSRECGTNLSKANEEFLEDEETTGRAAKRVRVDRLEESDRGIMGAQNLSPHDTGSAGKTGRASESKKATGEGSRSAFENDEAKASKQREVQNGVGSEKSTSVAAGGGLHTGAISAADGPTRVDLLTVLLLVCPSDVWAYAKDTGVREELQSLTNTCCLDCPLHNEILHLKEQYAALRSEGQEKR